MAKTPDDGKRQKRAARPTLDEAALFRAAMADAKPIERRNPVATDPDARNTGAGETARPQARKDRAGSAAATGRRPAHPAKAGSGSR